eukprot:TRINITY_DN188_c0_g2_i1.p1 TRINITY_DN188_c0_g2~~TRINITY_DN188_c0_g2_i1.p1  ORF type:complete len:964 (+),score=451.74 TRINITY_DN188_c0_g2_i1:210-3101(+)
MADKDENSAEKRAEKSAVRVMVRVRPFNKRELGDNPDEYPMSIVTMEGNAVNLMDQNGGLADSFEFHEAFWSIPEEQNQFSSKPFVDQEGVFLSVGLGAVENAIKGYHTCIFAYGQTGSGKTHTMLGSVEDPGIAPRLVSRLYQRLEEQRQSDYHWDYSVDVSFMEIYNEKVKDLLPPQSPAGAGSFRGRVRRSKSISGTKDSPLSPDGGETPLSSSGRKESRKHMSPTTPGSRRKTGKSIVPEKEVYADLRVRSSPSTGIYVEGLTRLGEAQGISTAEDVINTMRNGMDHRTTAATAMNDTSSRSHAVFQICLKANNPSKGIQRYAHINIVDLAGSERIKMSKVEGANLTEATKINLSLSTLRRVIDILIENSQRRKNQPKQLPPYRDSMLTWILSESLGGNSKTMMLATISPAESNREDTLNTLRYALKAKAIVNTVKVNEQKSSVMLSAMQKEMSLLRDQLNDPTVAKSQEEMDEMQAQHEALQKDYSDQLEGVERAAANVENMKSEIQKKEAEASLRAQEVAALKDERIEEKHEEVLKQHEVTNRRLEQKALRLDIVKNKANLTEEELQKMEEQKLNQLREKEETAVSAATQGHLKAHQKRELFKEAFTKAFILGARDKRQKEMHEDVRRTTSVANQLDMQIFGIREEIKNCQIVNMRHSANVSKIEGEILRIEQRRGHDARELEKDVASAQRDAYSTQGQAATLKKEMEEKLERVDATSSTVIAHKRKTGNSEAVLTSRVEEVRSVREEKNACIAAAHQNKKILDQLREDITAENERLRESTAINISKAAAAQAEVQKLHDDIERLRQELETTELSIRDIRDDISAMNGKKIVLRDRVDIKAKEHAELRGFVANRYFPNGKPSPIPVPDWQGEDLPDTTVHAQEDAHRAWVSGGMRYKRQTSPVRRSGFTREFTSSPQPGSPGRPISPFGRNETSRSSHTANGMSSPNRAFRRSTTLA